MRNTDRSGRARGPYQETPAVLGGSDGREFVGWAFGVRLLRHLEGGGCDQVGRDGEAISHSGRIVARLTTRPAQLLARS